MCVIKASRIRSRSAPYSVEYITNSQGYFDGFASEQKQRPTHHQAAAAAARLMAMLPKKLSLSLDIRCHQKYLSWKVHLTTEQLANTPAARRPRQLLPSRTWNEVGSAPT